MGRPSGRSGRAAKLCKAASRTGEARLLPLRQPVLFGLDGENADSPLDRAAFVVPARDLGAAGRALKTAKLCVLPEGIDDEARAVPGCEPALPKTAIACFKLPPWKTYTVKAVFENGPQTRTSFADLPLAERAEFEAQ